MISFDIYYHIEILGIFRFTVVMYQTIHETIRVAGIYQQAQFKPVWFDWQNRRYDVEQVTLISDFRQGKIERKIYSVKAAGDVYRLVHNLKNQSWFLEQIWIND